MAKSKRKSKSAIPTTQLSASTTQRANNVSSQQSDNTGVVRRSPRHPLSGGTGSLPGGSGTLPGVIQSNNLPGNPPPPLCPMCHRPATVDCSRTPKLCTTCCLYTRRQDQQVCAATEHVPSDRENAAEEGDKSNNGEDTTSTDRRKKKKHSKKNKKKSSTDHTTTVEVANSDTNAQSEEEEEEDIIELRSVTTPLASIKPPKISIPEWQHSPMSTGFIHISSWLNLAEGAKDGNRWTQEQAVRYAISRVTGPAEAIQHVSSFLQKNRGSLRWDLFKEDMIHHYSQHLTTSDITVELNNCRQELKRDGNWETIDAHAARFQSIARKCHSERFTEGLKIDLYLASIRSTIKERVTLQVTDPNSYETRAGMTLTRVIDLCKMAELSESRKRAQELMEQEHKHNNRNGNPDDRRSNNNQSSWQTNKRAKFQQQEGNNQPYGNKNRFNNQFNQINPYPQNQQPLMVGMTIPIPPPPVFPTLPSTAATSTPAQPSAANVNAITSNAATPTTQSTALIPTPSTQYYQTQPTIPYYNPYANIQCHTCGQYGHMAKGCPYRQNNQYSQNNTNNYRGDNGRGRGRFNGYNNRGGGRGGG
jgi:hypothetical protein